MADYSCLINAHVASILDGSTATHDGFIRTKNETLNYQLPYLSHSKISELATKFGLTDGVGNREDHMICVLHDANDKGLLVKLIRFLLSLEHFQDKYYSIDSKDNIINTYQLDVQYAIEAINNSLFYSHKKLVYSETDFNIVDLNTNRVIISDNIDQMSTFYIRSLYKRIQENIDREEYDNVVTKSRTLLEEVCIYIIESKGAEPSDNGNVKTLYNECKQILGMTIQTDWDKRVKELLSGFEKIIDAIASMRNNNSDAHGVGTQRITIRKHEAILIANASIAVSEYLLNVYNSKI